MAMRKIKSGDIVSIIAGRDKGRSGKVLRFVSKNRAIVEGVNMIKKHMKPNPQKEQKGGIIERESGIDLSNLALLNPATNKTDKVRFNVLENSKKKVRVFKSNDENVDV